VKRSFYLIGALILGTVLANALLPENGYVAISFRGYLIEMSVPTLVLLSLVTLIALELLLHLVRLPAILRRARRETRARRARDDLARSLLQMAAGRWGDSEVTATRSARDSAFPAAHYLLAARAAALQGRHAQRDAWLGLAREAAPDEQGPALIMQAEECLARGEFAAAYEALRALEAQGRLNPRALLLLARVYRGRGEFVQLKALEPQLRDSRGIPPAAVDEMMDTLYLDMLRQVADTGPLEQVEAVWVEATRAARQRPPIVVAYARALLKFGAPERAANILEELLERDWSEAAVLLYGELPAGDAFARLKRAELWLRTRRDDPALLVACARLCLRAELVGKARSYLETSYTLRPRAATAQLLAGLLDQLGERDRALELLNSGLATALGQRAELPPLPPRRWRAPRR
jgi:HemY protein